MATILIVDDRPTNREFLSTLLSYGGHRLFEAGDGAEALRLVRDERPDLVISDILMPTMDGFEFAKSVRAEPAIANTKIVFYTATYRAQEARLLATACGVSAVIAKPADPQRVLDVVNEQLGIAAPQSIPQTLIGPLAQKPADSVELSRLGETLSDYVNDLRGVKMQLDGLVGRGLEFEQERERLRGISATFAQNLTKLHTTTARLYALVELGMDLGAERDPQRLLQTFAGAARRIIGCRSVLALLLHATEKRKQYAATDGLAPECAVSMEPVALGEGLTGQLLDARAPIRLVAAQGEQSVRGLPAGHPTAQSLLGVAIRTEARCYGFVLCADKIGAASGFNEEDGQLAQALAAQLAVIYENFELYDVLQRHAAELQVEVSERVQLQAALKEREAGLNYAQQMAMLAHAITGPDGAFESWSETLLPLAGLEPERMPRTTREWLTLLHPDDRESFRQASIDAGREHARQDLEYRLQRPDGASICVRHIMEPLEGELDAEGRGRWFNMLQDVTGQKQAETRIKRLNRVYAVLSGINGLIVRAPEPDELFRESCRIAVEHGGFTAAWAGLVDRAAMEVRPVAWQGVDEDHVLAVPRSLDEASSRAGIIGQAVRDRRAIISNDMENDARLLLGARAAALGSRSLVALPLVVGGETLGVLVLHSREKGFFDDQEMKLLLELAGDIAFALDHNEKGRKLDYLAYYDSLTGLANRTLFNERLQQTIAEAGSGRAALFLIDIERFKTINDTFGRQSGDALLKQVAERMVRYGGGGARMGRIGADQFATMVTDFESEERLARFTEKRQSQVFGAPFKVGDQEVRLAARVGIALYPENGADPEALQASAEAALLKAKAGGERYLFFAPEMTARVAETLALENKLRVALEKEEFVLHYQPKVDLETGRIAGLEALIRWQSPELGLVPPGHFIPLLEETGLILQVGSWALARAARDHRAWTEQKLSPPRVAVNVSPIQLRQRDFVAVVKQAIRDGVAPSAIDLEITESLIMQDVQANIEKLNAVRSLGLDIAIDDFGTGYSSLGYLAKLPVQTLKIDRSFIIAMNQDPNAMTLVSTIIALAHSLRLRVVAEGVETEKQAKFLRLLRCEEMQGYLFSKPLPAAEIAAMLRKQAQGEPARADLSGG